MIPTNPNQTRNILKVLMILLYLFTLKPESNAQSNILRLTAASGTHSDEAIVRLHEDATFQFDPDWDALKLSNGGNTPNLYTEVSGMRYVINSIPHDFQDTSVFLNLQAAFSGYYSVTAEGIENFDSTYTIILEDKLLNVQQDLRENQQFDFYADVNDPEERFTLRFQKKNFIQEIVNAVNKVSIEEQIRISAYAGRAYISFHTTQLGNADIAVLNSNGTVIYNEENISTSSAIEIPLPNSSNRDIFIVRIILNNQMICKKILN